LIKELHVERSMGEILQILSLTLFEKTPILQALSQQPTAVPEGSTTKQLSLFTF